MYQFESSIPFCEPSSGLDLRFYYCGTMECDTARGAGPAIRDHYCLHFIQNGSGTLTIDGKSRPLSGGQCFVIRPDTLTAYEPSHDENWAYHWVAFNGLNAHAYLARMGFTQEKPVIDVSDPCALVAGFERMYASSAVRTSGDLRLLAELYGLFAVLMDGKMPDTGIPAKKGDSPMYAARAVEWFSLNYSRNISIAGIARFIGLNPKYFSRIFKDETGLSPQNFLIRLRMNKARELLMKNDLSVGEIARSVGYEDQLLFSRMFKKIMGTSPAIYRKENS